MLTCTVTVLINWFSYVFAGIAIISVLVIAFISAFIIGMLLVLATRRKKTTDVMLWACFIYIEGVYTSQPCLKPGIIDTIGEFIFAWDQFSLFAYQSQSAKICTRKVFFMYNPSLVGSVQSPCCCRAMALLHYFTPVNGHLPDPTGPLSADIPPPAIHLDVLAAERQAASTKTRSRGPYSRLTNKQRAQMGKSVRLLPQWRHSCHSDYSSPACTRDSLLHSTHSGIRESLWHWNCTGKSLPCHLSQHAQAHI